MPIRIIDESSINVPAFSLDHPLVVNYFKGLPEGQRDEALQRALVIGAMALRDERIAAFLARTESELGANLEHLKQLFDNRTLRMTSPGFKGDAGELAMANSLASWVEGRKLPDVVQIVGKTAGALPRNKTGDIVCTVGEGEDAPLIVIEGKLDKSIRLGDPSADGLTSGKSDTAWSQLVEAKANRGADMAIMVFAADSTDRTIAQFTDAVRYIDSIGFVVVVDIVRGDFRPLSIAYELARQHVLSRQRDTLSSEVMDTLVRRLCSDLTAALAIKDHLQSAKASIDAAADQIDRHLVQAAATQKALQAYLKTGKLDQTQLLELLVPHKVPTVASVAAIAG